MKTLAELKAENAAEEENGAVADPTETEQETETDAGDEVDATTDEAGEPDQQSETDDSEGGEETEPEAWMQADDEASETDSETVVPLAAHTKMRGKLKAKLGERDSEIESLRQEIEALKKGVEPQEQVQQPRGPVAQVPTLSDFDYDEARYAVAMREWMRTHDQIDRQQEQQQAAQAAAQAALDKHVDGHYQRAAKLAKESGIEAEVYRSADINVRRAIDLAMPGLGDGATDRLIAQMGEGSEKVMYYVGRNTAAQNALVEKLRQDPTGLSAAMYLGELKTKVTAPLKKRSNAPKPAGQATGGSTGGASEAAMLKRYKEAHKKGNHQAAYNAKKSAKAAGVDTSNW